MTEENLFGDNLTQDIKDVNIRRKFADPSTYSYRQYSQKRGGNRGYGYQNYGNYNNYNSYFLWGARGRGRSSYRASQNNQNRNQSNQQYQKKHEAVRNLKIR